MYVFIQLDIIAEGTGVDEKEHSDSEGSPTKWDNDEDVDEARRSNCRRTRKRTAKSGC